MRHEQTASTRYPLKRRGPFSPVTPRWSPPPHLLPNPKRMRSLSESDGEQRNLQIICPQRGSFSPVTPPYPPPPHLVPALKSMRSWVDIDAESNLEMPCPEILGILKQMQASLNSFETNLAHSQQQERARLIEEYIRAMKGRAVEPGLRWRTAAPTAADNVELFAQMARDATAAQHDQSNFSYLSELWSAIDNVTCNKKVTKTYMQMMKTRSMQIVMVASSETDGCVRLADEGLQQQCAKLIQKLPELSIEKRQIDELTPLEDLWKAVSKLATQYSGEVVLLQPEDATWVLTEVNSEDCLATNYFQRQFLVNEREEALDFASSWLGETAQRKMQSMVRTAAWHYGVHESALSPCWQNQTMRIVAPVCEPEKLQCPMEWRLYGKVTTIGQLLLQLGSTMDLFVAC